MRLHNAKTDKDVETVLNHSVTNNSSPGRYVNVLWSSSDYFWV